MKTKHTTGEWSYSFSSLSNLSENGQFTVKAGDVGRPICVVPLPIGGINGKAKQEANAKLIAAAPDLLEALQECVGAMEVVTSYSIKPFIERAGQAIKKSTK